MLLYQTILFDFLGEGSDRMISFGARTQKSSRDFAGIISSRGNPQKSILLSYLFSGPLRLYFGEGGFGLPAPKKTVLFPSIPSGSVLEK